MAAPPNSIHRAEAGPGVAADADAPLRKLETRFSLEWEMVKKELPTWKTDFADLAKSTIVDFIKDTVRVDARSAIPMSTLVFEYFAIQRTAAPPLQEDPAGWPKFSVAGGKAIYSLEDVADGYQPDATGSALLWVSLSSGAWIFHEAANRMIRRDEYPKLWKRVKQVVDEEKHSGLMIKGHPGIGKTLLLDLIAASLLVKYPTIPIVSFSISKVTVLCRGSRGEEKRWVIQRSKLDNLDLPAFLQQQGVAAGQKVVVLHDIKTTKLPFLDDVVLLLKDLFVVKCIIATSPAYNNYQTFQHMFPSNEHHVLPVLTRPDAKAFVDEVDPEEQQSVYLAPEARYDAVGGVPRHLCSTQTVANAQEEQRTAVHQVKFDPAQSLDSGTSENATDPSRIIMLVPNEERNGAAEYDFVSSDVRALWLRTRKPAEEFQLLEAFRNASDAGAPRRLLGQLYEDWVVKLLEAPRFSLSRRHLPSSPAGSAPGKVEPFLECHASAAGDERQLYLFGEPFKPSIATTMPKHTIGELNFARFRPVDGLHVPLSCDFPEFDAVLMNGNKAYLVQVTLQAQHRPKSASVSQLLAELTSKTARGTNVEVAGLIYVVTTASKLRSYQKLEGDAATAFDGIRQYLCHADDPSKLGFARPKDTSWSTVPVVSFAPRPASDAAAAVLAAVTENVQQDVKKIESGEGTVKSPWSYS